MNGSKLQLFNPDNISKIHKNPITNAAATAIFHFSPTLGSETRFAPNSSERGGQDRVRWTQIHVLAWPKPPPAKTKIPGRNTVSQLVKPARQGHLICMYPKDYFICMNETFFSNQS